MRKIKVSNSEVMDSLTKIVSEQGEDFIYQPPEGTLGQCQYVHNGRPDCLVGKALYQLGVSVDLLRTLDHEGGMNIGKVDLAQLGLDMPPEALEALDTAQMLQDGQETWGTALQAAKKALEGYLEDSIA
jgi:hypothetical protein